MNCNRKILAYALLTSLGIAPALDSASAACAFGGSWYFFAHESMSPGITTNTKSVVVGPLITNKAMIESFTFSPTSTGYENGTASIIKCKMTIPASGHFSGAPCTAYTVADPTPHNVTISGALTLTSCVLGGTITIPGDSGVTIRGGYVNGTAGSGIATQGQQVMYFTLIKQ